MSLRRKSFAAVRWSTLDSAITATLRMASIVVLARILEPEDYGLMAMVSVVLGIAALFSDLGINSAFVQRQKITLEQRSSLYWLNISSSVGLALLVVLVSPLLARFVGDARLTSLTMLSSLTFIIVAIGQQVKMAAEKDLRMKAVVVLDLAAALVGFAVAVLAALSGWGVYALVVSAIAKATVASTLFWIFLSRGWRPLRRFRKEDVVPFLGFGGATVANNFVNYINRTVDVFLGGRLLGVADLGYYSVPRNLVLEASGLVNSAITRVGFPLIARVQSDLARVRSIYLQTMNMTASTNAPLYLGVALFAPEIVAIILGPDWERSGELLRVLALWGGLRSTGNPVGSLLYGMGRAGLSLKWNLSLLLIVPPAIWIGSRAGPLGIAWTLLILQIGLFVPAWYFLVRPLCRAKLLEYSVAALKPFVLAGMSMVPCYWIAAQIDGAVVSLVVGFAVGAPTYLTLSLFANREWVKAMGELVGISNNRANE